MGRISLTVGSGSLVGITIIIIDKCLSVCVEGVHFIVNFIICFSLEILSINERRKFIKGKKDYRRHSLICTAISIFIFTPLSPYLWEKFQFDWTSIAHMEYVWYGLAFCTCASQSGAPPKYKGIYLILSMVFSDLFTPYDKSLSFLEQSKKTLGKCNTVWLYTVLIADERVTVTIKRDGWPLSSC